VDSINPVYMSLSPGCSFLMSECRGTALSACTILLRCVLLINSILRARVSDTLSVFA